ncbi:hypothetical protein GLYMA_03G263050v4 [Glycine max]|nr:hypothetical protein GLYMA_03G263050v4 [Glycine max]KAH1071960.1 hypothetical protein GYH30_008435 [Glycine max]
MGKGRAMFRVQLLVLGLCSNTQVRFLICLFNNKTCLVLRTTMVPFMWSLKCHQ